MRAPRRAAVASLLALLLAARGMSAAEFFLRGAGLGSTEKASFSSIDLSGGIVHESGELRIGWELGMDTDGTYPAPFLGDFFGDFSVDIREAGLSYGTGALSLGIGRLAIKDVVDSPYSLFASGAGLTAMTAFLVYDNAHIFFSNRWIGLNRNLKDGLFASTDPEIYDDRGATIKTYAVRFGRLRLGFQDAAVFTGDYFDIDFFANIAPSFFVQYVAKAPGRPWTRTGDQNAIMGLFADYAGDDWYAYAQLLVDDINLNRILNPEGSQNPDKIAFSLGGHLESPAGRFGLYAAAATKYVFESIGGRYYSYTYYPGSAVEYRGTVAVPLEEMMIGYRNGENNLALRGEWSRGEGAETLSAFAEFVLSGSKSPANPWHEYGNWREEGGGLRFLDDRVLEKRISIGAAGRARLGDFLFEARGALGWVGNRLALEATATSPNGDGNAEPIWRPSDESGPLIELSVGCRWAVGL